MVPAKRKVEKPKHADCLDSWAALMEQLPKMSDESEVKALLDYELTNGKRISFVKRLHTRATRLRQARELDAYEEVCSDAKAEKNSG